MENYLDLRAAGLAAVAALLAWVGMYVKGVLGERARRARSFEKSVIAWLNVHGDVLRQTESVAKRAVDEPEDHVAHQELVNSLGVLQERLVELDRRFDELVVYSSIIKSVAIWQFSAVESMLIKGLSILIKHHKTHLDFNETIEKSRALSAALAEADPATAELARKLADVGVKHVKHCREGLKRDATWVYRYALMLRKASGPFRWLITRSWL